VIPNQNDSLTWDRYAYVENNPINHNDPTGHCPFCVTALIGGAVGAIVGAVGYTAYSVVSGNQFNTDTMLLVTGGATVAGALIGTGVGFAAGMSTAAATTGLLTTGGMVETANVACGSDMCISEASNAGQTLQEVVPNIEEVGQLIEDTSLDTARTLGNEGEQAAGIIKNTTRIPSLTNSAKYRIPDQLIPKENLISEVKNVGYQSLTSQLQDYSLYAQQKGYDFDLIIRETTKLSGPL
jgi:hypothetical protein